MSKLFTILFRIAMILAITAAWGPIWGILSGFAMILVRFLESDLLDFYEISPMIIDHILIDFIVMILGCIAISIVLGFCVGPIFFFIYFIGGFTKAKLNLEI